MKLKKIVDFLDNELDICSVDDKSVNGLQVENSKEIKKIGLAVDACIDTFKLAKKEKVDLLIVHHGLFWSNRTRVTGLLYKRVKYLLDNNIALYAAHLPLDAHDALGNNTSFLRALGVKKIEQSKDVMRRGDLSSTINIKDLEKKINNSFNTRCRLFLFGKQKIKRIAICTGAGGSGYFLEAIKKKIDVYISGEEHHNIYLLAKEANINLIFAGHYATETLGVKNVGKLLEKKFKLKIIFLDNPTKL